MLGDCARARRKPRFSPPAGYGILVPIAGRSFGASRNLIAGGGQPMATYCALCGAEYPSDKGLCRRSFRSRRSGLVCPGCVERRVDGWQLYYLGLSALALLGGLLAGTVDGIAGMMTVCGAIGLTGFVLPAIHEAAHAAATLVLRARLFAVNIGVFGRVCFSRKIGSCRIVVRRIQQGGLCAMALRSLRFFRLRQFLIVLAAPLTEGLLLAAGLLALEHVSPESPVAGILIAITLMLGLQLVVGLLPWRHRLFGQRIPSDGMQLLAIPFMNQAAREAAHAMWFYQEAIAAGRDGDLAAAQHWLTRGRSTYPDDVLWTLGSAWLDMQHGRYAESRQAWCDVLGRPADERVLLPLIRNNIAWSNLMAGNRELLEETDRLSAAALDELPQHPLIQGTRGAVLIELGRPEGGVPLLHHALWAAVDAQGRALNLCYLAIAAQRSGDASRARQLVAQARAADSRCPLLDRVEAEIAASTI